MGNDYDLSDMIRDVCCSVVEVSDPKSIPKNAACAALKLLFVCTHFFEHAPGKCVAAWEVLPLFLSCFAFNLLEQQKYSSLLTVLKSQELKNRGVTIEDKQKASRSSRASDFV